MERSSFMKRHFLCGLMAVGMATSFAFAQANPRTPAAAQPAAAGQQGNIPAELDRTLKAHFPNAKYSVSGEHEQDGVRVYNVQITPQNGQGWTAEATEHGDFLATGARKVDINSVPANVREVLSGIWRSPPQEIDDELATFYLVTIGAPGANTGGTAASAGSRLYELRLDATGRLLDIKAPTQLHHENWQSLPNAPQNVASQLEQVGKQRYPNAQMVGVKQEPNNAGYQLRFTINGADGWMITDENQQVVSEASTLDKNRLPKPVTDSINTLFKGDRIAWAAREDVHFYQARINEGNEPVTLRVQPNGDVLSVHTRGGQEINQAVTAGQRQRGQRNRSR